MRLYINIDHVATVRQARRTDEPDPVRAAVLAELGGADGITIHLREDRRHISDRDMRLLAETVRTGINFELAAAAPMVDIAMRLAPMQATLVPEKREEVTTEGGLDLASAPVRGAVGASLRRLDAAGVRTSLFIDPDPDALDRSAELGAHAVELHTGEYANATGDAEKAAELTRLANAAAHGRECSLAVHAGHGLTYENVIPVAALPHIEELNIGHSVISRAVLVGMERAVREMKEIVLAAPGRVPEPGRWLPPMGCLADRPRTPCAPSGLSPPSWRVAALLLWWLFRDADPAEVVGSPARWRCSVARRLGAGRAGRVRGTSRALEVLPCPRPAGQPVHVSLRRGCGGLHGEQPAAIGTRRRTGTRLRPTAAWNRSLSRPRWPHWSWSGSSTGWSSSPSSSWPS